METFDLSEREKHDLLNELCTYFNFADLNHFFEVIDDTPAYDEILEELYRIARPAVRANFAIDLRENDGYYLVAEGNGRLSVVAKTDTHNFACLVCDGLKNEGWDVEIWRVRDGSVLSLFEDGTTETLAP